MFPSPSLSCFQYSFDLYATLPIMSHKSVMAVCSFFLMHLSRHPHTSWFLLPRSVRPSVGSHHFTHLPKEDLLNKTFHSYFSANRLLPLPIFHLNVGDRYYRCAFVTFKPLEGNAQKRQCVRKKAVNSWCLAGCYKEQFTQHNNTDWTAAGSSLLSPSVVAKFATSLERGTPAARLLNNLALAADLKSVFLWRI